MKDNLKKIGYTLDSIKANDTCIRKDEVENFYNFYQNYGHNSIQNIFVNF